MPLLPSQLTSGHFSTYPPEARQVATRQIAVLRKLPLSFLPLLLRELIVYDWKFPEERKELDSQLSYLALLSAESLDRAMAPFAALILTENLKRLDWVNAPVSFSEQLSADFWATHQIDSFRKAATDFMQAFRATVREEPPVRARLAIAVIGQGVDESKGPLFRKLRPHGMYYRRVQKGQGLRLLMDAVAARAKAYPAPFGHWYVDGGPADPVAGVSCVSFGALANVRTKLVSRMRAVAQAEGGPEAVRSALAQIQPRDVGLGSEGSDAVLSRFQMSALAEGSGAQFFSTTFVQWTARELLRRARPLTVLARFTPRQSEYSLDRLLADSNQRSIPDPAGSLVDADMGAYYTWLNLQRLPGAAQSRFLVWFEDREEALAIAPDLPRGAELRDAIELERLIQQLV